MKSTASRDRARRGSGEPSAPPPGHDDLAVVIAALQTKATKELRIEWRKLHRTAPPSRLSRDLMLRAIAYAVQENVDGGLGLAMQRRLNDLVRTIIAKGAAQFDPGLTLKPGSRLVREWHGRAHTVIVLEDGFEYDGQRYRSLSKVAQQITGVHWSGPAFFGLKRRAAAALGTAP